MFALWLRLGANKPADVLADCCGSLGFMGLSVDLGILLISILFGGGCVLLLLFVFVLFSFNAFFESELGVFCCCCCAACCCCGDGSVEDLLSDKFVFDAVNVDVAILISIHYSNKHKQ